MSGLTIAGHHRKGPSDRLGFHGEYKAWCFEPITPLEALRTIQSLGTDDVLWALWGRPETGLPIANRQRFVSREGKVVRAIESLKRDGVSDMKAVWWQVPRKLRRSPIAPMPAVKAEILRCIQENGRLRWHDRAHNLVVTAGLNNIEDVMFGQGSQTATWAIGLIRDDNYSTIAAADTMASHAGWEEGDEYDEANRVAWDEGSASGGVITSSTTSDFTISDTETFKGSFLCSDNTKSGSSGTLFSAGLFDEGDRACVDDDVLSITYTLTAADA